MSPPLGSYSFLPWVRHGLSNSVTAADFDPNVSERAAVAVTVRVTGDAVAGGQVTEDVPRDVALYGPGDIVGIDPRAIVRTEPRAWITNFEPNYLAFVEFYDEDFLWRYTPTAPHGPRLRLRPWLVLAVLVEGDEFEDVGALPGKPLPSITIDDLGLFPAADELWAWGHVHVDRSLAGAAGEIVSDDMNAVLPRFSAVLAEKPDLAESRLVCPRRLVPNQAYHAFVLPAFETGRLAGLGLDPGDSPSATTSSWETYAGRAEPSRFPYYHRWYFRTGTIGDFEYLVRLLKPRPVDPRVGSRDMDVQRPGSDLPPIANPALGGVLRLGGALRVPEANLDTQELAEAALFENWDTPYPHPFQSALAALVNLADGYAAGTESDPDPLITPPLYGRWHALTARLLTERDGTAVDPDDNWVHELNLDPRFRVAAGFGTRVVRERQEEYMAAAWEQIGDVLEANRRIRLAQLAREVAHRLHARAIQAQLADAPERVLALTAPAHVRVVADGVTVAHRVRTSLVAAAPLSAAMRRVVRPRSRLVRSLGFAPGAPPGRLLTRLAAGDVVAAPPKAAPPGIVTVADVAEELRPSGVPRPLLDALVRRPWLRFLPLLVAVIVALVVLVLVLAGAGPLALVVGAVLVVALVALWRLLSRWRTAAVLAEAVGEETQGPEAVDALPNSPDFELTEAGSGATPPRTGSTDSREAIRFKQALREATGGLRASARAAFEPPRSRLDVGAVARAVARELHPDRTIPRRTLNGIVLPERLAGPVVENFVEAMANPRIDVPMYRPLVDLSSELFLPNINLIPQDSITLLETNQRFIEAYLVGVNHEFARELLWREYPTDQRGTSFRQFWDVSVQLGPAGEDPEERRERLYDIPPLHRWPRASELGDHDDREVGGAEAEEEEVVLVVRGELLKKYPTTVVYAHRAEWVRLEDGSIDPEAERRLVALTPAQEADPPRDVLRTPLYEAKADPDIYFFGFDLTAEVARGGTGENDDDDPGWFFVLRERPGEARFGFDIERSGDLNVWNDLAWPDVADAADTYIPVGAGVPVQNVEEPTEPEVAEKHAQWEDDRAVTWGPDMTAADVAYVLYQAPVLVAVHARELLE